MKGVILSVAPATTLVDLSHSVPPFDVRHAAALLAESWRWFPAETIHVAVVDPGVGGARKIVYAQMGGQHFLAPDNGLLQIVAARQAPSRLVSVENPAFWLGEVSPTFHGRDIFAPVAARLRLGLDPADLGPPLARLAPLPDTAPPVHSTLHGLEGVVAAVDRFGNLITNIPARLLPASVTGGAIRVDIAGRRIDGMCRTFSDRAVGELTVLVGSSGTIEIAVVQGSALAVLGIGRGEVVTVSW
jgi:hypothetical protein